jgi:hemerythrin
MISDKICIHNFFEQTKREHQELVGLMSDIRYMLTCGKRDAPQVDETITQLCNLVESHFLWEEEGGYLSEVVAHRPELTRRTEQLHGQHTMLLDELRGVRQFAQERTKTEEWWHELHSRFSEFSRKLLTHEAHEDDLVQEALAGDKSRGD